MKILTLVYSLGKGGTQRAAQNFAIAYKLNGHDSKLAFTEEDGPRNDYLRSENVEVYDLRMRESYVSICRWSPDVIHLHSHGLSLYCVNKVITALQPKYVWETNVFSCPSKWETLLTKSFQLSRWCLWLYIQRNGNRSKAVVIPNPIDSKNFFKESDERMHIIRSSLGLSKSHCILGRVGQAIDGKWASCIIPIFEQLRSKFSHLRLLLVDPPASIQNQASKSKCQHDIIVIKSIYDDNYLRAIYSIIDIFFHVAEQGESFGMVLAESLLCETPVVTLATPWADNSQGDVVKDMVGGLVAKRVTDLPRLLKSLIVDKHLRNELGKNGRSHILANYEASLIAAKAIQIGTRQPESLYPGASLLSERKEGKHDRMTLYWHERLIFMLGAPGLLVYSRGYASWKILLKKKLRFFALRQRSKGEHIF